MAKSDFIYLLDSISIESFLSNHEIVKQAGVSDVIQSGLGGAVSGIQSFIKNNVDFSSPKDAGLSLIKILGPGILFRINPFIGAAIHLAASMYGFNIPSIWDSLFNPIKTKIEEGAEILPGEIDGIIKSHLTAELHESLDELQKYAQRAPTGGFAAFPPKNMPMLYKMFGFLGPNKAKNIVVGFLAWFLKTALVSAGLMGGSAGIAKMLNSYHPKKQTAPSESENESGSYQYLSHTPSEGPSSSVPMPKPQMHSLKPSGKGEQYHTNNNSSIWIVPLQNGIENTLKLWATEVYPELKGNESKITAAPSFNRMVNILDEFLDSNSPNYLIIPKSFNRIKDIVDTFAGEIKKENKQDEK